MADTMTSAPARGRKGRQVPTYYYAIAAGVLATGYLLYSNSKKKTAAAAAAAGGAAPSTTPTTANYAANGVTTDAFGNVVPAGTTAASQYGEATDLLTQLAQLQGAASTPTTSTPTNPLTDYTTQTFTPGQVTASGQTVLGGFEPAGGAAGSLIGTDGHTYQFLSDFQQALAARSTGDKFYIETAPGVFSPEPTGKYAGAGWLQVA